MGNEAAATAPSVEPARRAVRRADSEAIRLRLVRLYFRPCGLRHHSGRRQTRAARAPAVSQAC